MQLIVNRRLLILVNLKNSIAKYNLPLITIKSDAKQYEKDKSSISNLTDEIINIINN